ncbi:polysaccharide lyase family 8 protein [Phlegmacium glaucopus]|nr:polysaccharide lyase family 8 protein [Phlegmacium glaucopus]
MWRVLLVFIIYTLFQTHILLFLPVGAKFQQRTVELTSLINSQLNLTLNPSVNDVPPANASSSADGAPSSGTSTVAPTAQPTQTIDPSIAQDIESIRTRRLSSIIGTLSSPMFKILICNRLSTLESNGKWPDNEVDYTTGCAARRANWPAQTHWQRILVMAGAWHGGLNGADEYVKDPALRTAISSAMDYWFGRDFTNPACLDSGGTPQCPCANTDNSLWNTNWFSNIILIPELVSQTCLLLNDTLAPAQLDKCIDMTGRSYATFSRTVNGLGTLTGANTLDVAKIGIDQALLTSNISLLTDAYQRVHSELQIKNGNKVDGIRADGSFGQHAGILYNGNYGVANDVLDLEVEGGGTMFAAGSDSQNAFATLFEGNRWMIFRNTLTGVLHWDFSVLGRFISFPVIDAQATESIKINLTEVLDLGQQWSSDALIDFANDLSENTTHANSGNLIGNRMFYANDYMVHRGRNYVSTLKMYSSRTRNTECTNSQNPKGFHLSDGVLHTYLRGNEYEDIAASWDWDLIPGITVDYGATALACNTTGQTGREAFVGGVSDGKIGIAAMRYTNPLNGFLHWQKTWFFLEGDVQHTMISALNSATSAPVYSVLDQRLHNGPVIVDGAETLSTENAPVQSLWHGDVGYIFPDWNDSAVLSVDVDEKNGSWSAIGTSSQPPATVDLFTARIEHKSISTPLSYTTFPGTSYATFLDKSNRLRLQFVHNDENISAVFDEGNKIAMVIFWDTAGGSVTFNPAPLFASITIVADGNIALIYRLETGEVTVSDPSQSLTTTQVTLTLGLGRKPPQWGTGLTKSLIFDHPSGGLAGSSISQTVS